MCESKCNLSPPNTAVMGISPSLAAPFSRLCILVSGPLSPMTQHSTGPEQPEQGRCGRRLAFGIKGNLKQFGLPVSAVSSRCVRTQSHSRQCHLVVLVKIRPWKNSRHSLSKSRHWHSFLLCVYALIPTPKMSANENRSQVKNKAVSCSWMGKFPELP